MQHVELDIDVGMGKHIGQEMTGMRAIDLYDLLRRSACDDQTAAVAALGTHIDHPVGGFDHVEVMLDHDHRVAGVDQAVQHLEQPLHIGEVQAGGRLVKDIDGAAGGDARQLLGQLDALRLAARERGGRLAERDIVQPDVVQRLQDAPDARHIVEELQRGLHVHLQHVGDALALVLDLERLAIVALAFADIAAHPHIGQELHLDALLAVALAGLAAPALDVEREAPRLVAAQLGLGRLARTCRGSGRTA